MSSESAISEQLVSAGPVQMFANNCLKRKLEVAGRNGLSATVDHDMGFQDHDCGLTSEKRQRFSNHLDSIDSIGDASSQEVCTISQVSDVNNGNTCSSNDHNGNSIAADSLLQNNLECHVPDGDEETVEMEFECQSIDTNGCPPNLKDESISPAREFLQKHRPEYQIHCIPSYCHPGGLWDVMLEVYHGL